MRVYVDSDGVVADFNKRWFWVFDQDPHTMREKYGKEKLWEMVYQRDPYFFARLELMPDARDLIDGLKLNRFDPIILTGSPVPWADVQKWQWGNLWFPSVPMIVTKAKEKHLYCRPGDVLIDDRTKYKKLWEDAGGIFIVHTDAKSSLEKLLNFSKTAH